MALDKMTTFKGFMASYWRIVNATEDIQRGITTVTLALYAGAGARIASPVENILTQKTVQVKAVDQTRTQLYVALKAMPDFKDAKDC